MDTENHVCETCAAFDTKYCPFIGCVNEGTKSCDQYISDQDISDECESCKIGD